MTNLSAENLPERPRDNFQVQNFYNPEALFTLLSKDYFSSSYLLHNNWNDITEYQYDPINHVRVKVKCDLAAKYDSNVRDRYHKVYLFRARLYEGVGDFGRSGRTFVANLPSYSMSEDKRAVIQKELYKSGIDLDWQSSKNEHGMIQGNFLTPAKYSPSVYLDVNYNLSGSGDHDIPFDTTRTVGRGFQLAVPWPHESLSNLEDFIYTQESFFSVLEKVIKTIYTIQEKDLPPRNLEFKPTEKIAKEFLATCSYCQQDYFTAQSLTCPSCGASKPHFLIEK